MNKSKIKTFAIWARQKLMDDVRSNAHLIGITAEGINDSLPQSTADIQYFDIGTNKPYAISGDDINRRDGIVRDLKMAENEDDYKTAYMNMIEHTASTWFNRLAAIRFMEVNDYFDDGLRVLSSVNEGSKDSDIMVSPFDSDLEFTEREHQEIVGWKLNNDSEKLFEILLQKKCRQIGVVLPGLFTKDSDPTVILMNFSITDVDGIIFHITHDIDEEEWKDQVQIIGWLYQYYNEERKNEVINIYKGTIKKEDIPAATQLFTTDWVVRYMVDNSLGRYWIERNPGSKLADKLDYFVTPKNGEIEYIDEKIMPEELTFFDPCMGSGHILVYAVDVLFEIYREMGYTIRDSVSSIIENNIFGLDIDERAYQLAYFAIMMKARSYDRRFLSRNIEPNLSCIEESNGIKKINSGIVQIEISDAVKDNVNYLLDIFKDAKETGSLVSVDGIDFDSIEKYMSDFADKGANNLLDYSWYNTTFSKMNCFIRQGKILSGKYAVVCTNPPYMNKMDRILNGFVKKEYKDYCGDLFSVFMYRNFGFCKKDGYSAFMTPFVWMFIKTYEKLREFIIEQKSIVSLVQMEYSAFEEATVPICSFILKNGKEKQKGLYFKLSDFIGGMEVQNQKVLEALENRNCGYFYETSIKNYFKIPGSPIAYWASDSILKAYLQGRLLGDCADVKIGMGTGKNDIFVREWWEVNHSLIDFSLRSITEACNSNGRYFPYNKGGEFRLWYGNLQEVLWFDNDGQRKMNTMSGHRENGGRDYYCKEGLTWSFISSSKFGIRYMPTGCFFDVAGSTLFSRIDNLYTLGFLASNVCFSILSILNPTLNYQAGNIKSLPILTGNVKKIDNIVQSNIDSSKSDWDSFETSWDFTMHPLILYKVGAGYADALIEQWRYKISDAFESLKSNVNEQFSILKSNEEELNRIFICIYGLQDELTPEEEDKDVTVHYIVDTKDDAPEGMRNGNYLLTKQDVIKSFISYAVGCMFGRYSLDEDGLVLAGQPFKEKYIRATPVYAGDGMFVGDGGYAVDDRFRIKKTDGNIVKCSFDPDEDNCIPITDENYFSDDIVGRFVEFVRVVYGEDTLEENLRFVADALGGEGEEPRDVIRKYFLNDFFKDHCKTYSVTGSGKRPIYWLFDSGKQNGFKALVYMHRWNSDTIATVRVSYVTKVQEKYENELRAIELQLDHLSDPRQKALQQKRKEKIVKQVAEIKQYDELISHLALEHIDIDLDNGVKVNHEKVQHDKNGDRYGILAPIK